MAMPALSRTNFGRVVLVGSILLVVCLDPLLSDLRWATAQQAPAPQATAPQATAPQATAPQATAQQATAPQATAPQATVPQATVKAPVPPATVTAPDPAVTAKWRTAVASGELRQVPALSSSRSKSAPRMHRVLAVALDADGELLLIGEPLGNREPEFGLTREDLLDFLATAIASELGGESPGVSIDQARGGVLEPGVAMPVRYLGGVERTFLGHTLFEADRWLKCLGMGRNNEDGTALAINLPNEVPHHTVLEFRGSLLAQNVGPAPDPQGSLNRFWFMPRVSGLVVSEDERVVSLVSPVVVETEAMVMRPGLPAQGAGQKDPASEQFARHISQNLDAYAERYAVFVWLREAAKMVTLARALVNGALPESFQRVDLLRFTQRYRGEEFPTFEETPAILATLNVAQGNAVLQMGAVGGVDLTPRGLTRPDSTEAQRLEAYGKVERLTLKAGADASLDPEPLALSLRRVQPLRLADDTPAEVYRVSLANDESIPGEQSITIVDQALADRGLSRRYRAGEPRRYARHRTTFASLARNSAARRSEVRTDDSLGGGWELVAPRLVCGIETAFQGIEAKLPQRVTLKLPGEPPIVFDELFGGDTTLEYHASRRAGERLEILDSGKAFRYVKEALTAEFDQQGRLNRLRDVTFTRDKDGRVTQVERDGQPALTLEYDDGKLARVTDAQGNTEEYRYRQDRLVDVRGTNAAGETVPAWNEVAVSTSPDRETPLPAPRTAPVAAIVLNLEIHDDGSIEFGQLGKPKVRVPLGTDGLRALPDHLVAHLRPLLAQSTPQAIMLYSTSLSNLQILQQQLMVQRALQDQGIAVVSTKSGALARATQHLREAEKLRVQSEGKPNVAVVACAHLFAERDRAERSVRESLPAFPKESWVTTPVDAVGAADSVVLWGERGAAWEQDVANRGGRGEFAGRHIVLLVGDKELEKTSLPQAMERSAALADRLIDFGAILVDGYYLDVPPEVSGLITQELSATAQSALNVDATPQAALEQSLRQLSEPMNSNPRARRLNPTIQRMRQNLFKRTEVQSPGRLRRAPTERGGTARLYCRRLATAEFATS
jgi:hypothetical protein